MKKIFALMMMFGVLFMYACGGASNEEKAAAQEDAEATVNEMMDEAPAETEGEGEAMEGGDDDAEGEAEGEDMDGEDADGEGEDMDGEGGEAEGGDAEGGEEG